MSATLSDLMDKTPSMIRRVKKFLEARNTDMFLTTRELAKAIGVTYMSLNGHAANPLLRPYRGEGTAMVGSGRISRVLLWHNSKMIAKAKRMGALK